MCQNVLTLGTHPTRSKIGVKSMVPFSSQQNNCAQSPVSWFTTLANTCLASCHVSRMENKNLQMNETTRFSSFPWVPWFFSKSFPIVHVWPTVFHVFDQISPYFSDEKTPAPLSVASTDSLARKEKATLQTPPDCSNPAIPRIGFWSVQRWNFRWHVSYPLPEDPCCYIW